MTFAHMNRKKVVIDGGNFAVLDLLDRSGGTALRESVKATMLPFHAGKERTREALLILVADGMIEMNLVRLTPHGKEVLEASRAAPIYSHPHG